jgi:hypothetical protein
VAEGFGGLAEEGQQQKDLQGLLKKVGHGGSCGARGFMPSVGRVGKSKAVLLAFFVLALGYPAPALVFLVGGLLVPDGNRSLPVGLVGAGEDGGNRDGVPLRMGLVAADNLVI